MIKDAETQEVIYHVRRDPSEPKLETQLPPSIDPNVTRCVYYTFHPSFLDRSVIGTRVTFSVGEQPLENLRMIERHYCGNTLIRSYDFTFSFCPPNTVNTWETEYEVPALSSEVKERILSGDYDTNTSDTFLFVGNKLFLHNKACYRYSSSQPQGGRLMLDVPPKPTIMP